MPTPGENPTRLVRCAQHSLAYDPQIASGCTLCRRSVAPARTEPAAPQRTLPLPALFLTLAAVALGAYFYGAEHSPLVAEVRGAIAGSESGTLTTTNSSGRSGSYYVPSSGANPVARVVAWHGRQRCADGDGVRSACGRVRLRDRRTRFAEEPSRSAHVASRRRAELTEDARLRARARMHRGVSRHEGRCERRSQRARRGVLGRRELCAVSRDERRCLLWIRGAAHGAACFPAALVRTPCAAGSRPASGSMRPAQRVREAIDSMPQPMRALVTYKAFPAVTSCPAPRRRR